MTTIPHPARALLRVLGVGFGIAVLVGNTIGSGILRNPGEVAGHLPSVALFLGVWIAGGVYALLGSNAVAEVATMIPESGGYTVFVRRGLGPYFGFVAGWSDWVSTCSSTSAAAIVIAESVNVLMGGHGPNTPLVAAAVLLGFAAVQWRGVRSAGNAQNVTTILKALAFLAFVAICFSWTGERMAPTAAAVIPQGMPLFVALVVGMQAVIFTYDGWVGPAYFAGELKDPGRELPRSIFGGVAAVIVIYLLVNVALLHVLPMARLAHDPFAAGTVAATVFGLRGEMILRGLVVLALLSAINAYLLMSSRTFYALSGSTGFALGARVNRGGTPTIALLCSAVAAAVFVLSGGYERVIAVTAFLFVANYTFTYLSLFALRRREPDAIRPYRAWGHPWSTGFVLIISIALLLGALVADVWNSLASIALLLLSYPIFRLLTRHQMVKAKSAGPLEPS
ncbi:MAG TPA: APC family permease [Chthoniobacterales bacterium]|nr:APC family permease [Chthoniobacterales bacterium]